MPKKASVKRRNLSFLVYAEQAMGIGMASTHPT